MRRALTVLAIGLCLPGSAAAGSPTYDVTIAAEKHDRKDVPVRISLPVKPAAVILSGPDGKTFPAQSTGPGLLAPKGTGSEIHFILPSLMAGESLRLKATIASEAPTRGDVYM